MTDADMLELVKQHLAMLGRMAQVAKVREVGTKKWIGSRKVIEAECLAAINKINDHQRATATLMVTLS